MINFIKAAFRLGSSIVREATKGRSSKWRSVRKEFLKKNKACAACGGKVRLQVHHISPFHLEPEKELDPTNLITLCMGRLECHLTIGHGGDFKSFNPHVKEDAAEILVDWKMRDHVTMLARTGRRTSIV